MASAEKHAENTPVQRLRPQTAHFNNRPQIAHSNNRCEAGNSTIGVEELRNAKSPDNRYLFSIPRATPEPFDDEERLPAPPRYLGDAKKRRCYMTAFSDDSGSTAKDNSYKDQFNRSMSCLDGRYHGLNAEKYPKMLSGLTTFCERLVSRPGPGSVVSSGSNFRLQDGDIVGPVNF